MIRITCGTIESLLGELENYNLYYSIMSCNAAEGFILAGRVIDGFKAPTHLTLNPQASSGLQGSFLTVLQFKNIGEMYCYIEGMLTILKNMR